MAHGTGCLCSCWPNSAGSRNKTASSVPRKAVLKYLLEVSWTRISEAVLGYIGRSKFDTPANTILQEIFVSLVMRFAKD